MITAKDCGYIAERVGRITSDLNGDSVSITVNVANAATQDITDSVFIVARYPTSTACSQSIGVHVQE